MNTFRKIIFFKFYITIIIYTTILNNLVYNNDITISSKSNTYTQDFLQLNKPVSKANHITTLNATIKVKGECNKKNCLNGKCNKSYCECNQGYGQVNNKNTKNSFSDKELCNYKLKNQILAFILESFLIFGIGHLYVHRILYGILKAICFLSIIFIDYIIKKIAIEKKSNKALNTICFISYILYFSMIIFHLYDIMMFAVNKHTDGYGMPLYAR